MKLRDLARWNPWWKGAREGSRYLERYFNYAFLLYRKLPSFEENYLIRGPRQVGKTEFIFKNIPKLIEANVPPENVTYILCDRLGGLRELRNTVRELRETIRTQPGKKFLLLDEVTGIEAWHKAVKEFCEYDDFVVYATGSRPKELEKKAEYFPGRAKIFNFYPLSFREFCHSIFTSMLETEIELPDWMVNRSNNLNKLIEFTSRLGCSRELAGEILKELEGLSFSVRSIAKFYRYFEIFDGLFRMYLEVGGYPTAIESKIQKTEPPFDLVVKDTLGTIEKEGLSLNVLNRLLPELLKKIGAKLVYSQLARDLEIDPATIMRYINTLERSFLLRELYYFDGKPYPRKGKKIFFSDPFIARALQNYYGIGELDEGQLVEGIVVEGMARLIERPFRRLWKNQMGYGMLRGREVDLIITKPKFLRIEVKYGKAFRRKGLDLILTKDELDVSKKPFKLPVSLFLLGL